MDELDLCRIADTLSLTDAAALLIGSKPSCVQEPNEFIVNRYHILDERNINTNPSFDGALRFLSHAAMRGTLPANLVYSGRHVHVRYEGNESEGYWEPIGNIDLHATTIDVEDFKKWLVSRGVKTGFFFPDGKDSPDYMDKSHPRYAVKLAAAVKVWQVMEDENLRRGKGTVDAMSAWLESRYKELGLVHEKDNLKNGTKAGDVNKSAISEAAKVANWQPGGGSPKTPGE